MPAFRHVQPVRFDDVDHAGLLYYPRYFHYFHLALEELLGGEAYRQLLDERRLGFPAVHAECDYRRPLRFGDRAAVDVSLVRLGDKSVTLRHVVTRVGDEAAGPCAEGVVTCACVDMTRLQAVPFPDDLRRIFAGLG